MTKVLGTDLGTAIADYEVAVAGTTDPLVLALLDATVDFRVNDVLLAAARVNLLTATWLAFAAGDAPDRLAAIIARVVTADAPDLDLN